MSEYRDLPGIKRRSEENPCLAAGLQELLTEDF